VGNASLLVQGWGESPLEGSAKMGDEDHILVTWDSGRAYSPLEKDPSHVFINSHIIIFLQFCFVPMHGFFGLRRLCKVDFFELGFGIFYLLQLFVSLLYWVQFQCPHNLYIFS